MTTRLRLDNLTAGYAGSPVLRDVSLDVAAGEVVALLGPNGAGKTTTLRTVSGILTPTHGRVLLDGEDLGVARPTTIARQGVAHVPEGRGIFSTLTVAQHFRLRRVGLDEGCRHFPALRPLAGRRAGVLSGGEQQMLALACALASRPRLLLVDELSLGLAPVIVEQILPAVRAYADESGAGVLLVEQHVALALEISDRAAVLSHGEIALRGSATELARDRDLLTASYLGAGATLVAPPPSFHHRDH